ncbi:Branched-chain-amino-acid aminotransferase [Exaiptasia diaphana]|nr:Branched-chain-amino-acid aminotransferase [Exaiptasia diaphana]
MIEWTATGGWATPKVVPYGTMQLSPATSALHYGLECFEGMKAYRGVDNKIRLFRPMENMKRMNHSASRASLPEFNGSEVVKCIQELIRVDKEWVPYSDTCSLYIRPTLIGTQITEVGTMNMFMLWINEQGEKELVTPPLNGLILPGVTRSSLLALGKKWEKLP